VGFAVLALDGVRIAGVAALASVAVIAGALGFAEELALHRVAEIVDFHSWLLWLCRGVRSLDAQTLRPGANAVQPKPGISRIYLRKTGRTRRPAACCCFAIQEAMAVNSTPRPHISLTCSRVACSPQRKGCAR